VRRKNAGIMLYTSVREKLGRGRKRERKNDFCDHVVVWDWFLVFNYKCTLSNTSVIDFRDHVLLCGISWSGKLLLLESLITLMDIFCFIIFIFTPHNFLAATNKNIACYHQKFITKINSGDNNNNLKIHVPTTQILVPPSTTMQMR
jgi:hypothetical protein